ncbi:DUF4381 domain-containing protein [Methylocaldum szegediense]|uniref:DUF4381 domain-containing protein n=1 Tax=Methylocaldum szegediense TaxID=73780 RepID=A0ABN8X9Y7_9GAMM|nr:DUF4381 domain-containing protein [Methylocaldum szegediense]CAI8886786.1 conserved protein of unknown function [Methylocaldum szegediense]
MDALPLRDIHLPEPISWWPPAIGWWIVAAIAILSIATATWLIRRWRQATVTKLALRELDRLEKDSSLGMTEKLRRLSVLLRRVGLSTFPREDVAGLTGEAWLEWLDRPFGVPRFSRGVGRALLDAPYRPIGEADFDGLIALCRDWLKALPRTVVTAQKSAAPRQTGSPS